MSRLGRLFSRRRVYSDLDEEVLAHLEEKTDALVARGVPRELAAAQARREFGNVTRVLETGREAWQWPTAESFVMDVRYALRQLRRSPGLAAAAILTLGIGIAANTTVFSWTRTVLLDPLPGAEDPGRVVAIEGVVPSGDWTPTSWLDFRDIRDNTTSFTSMAAAYPAAFAVGDEATAERRMGEVVSGGFFNTLGVRAARGRLFSVDEQDDTEGAHPVVVLGHGLWTTRFQADPGVIGSTILVNRYPFTIIGVTPADFHGSLPGIDRQMWIPATMMGRLDPNGGMFLRDRKTRMFRVLARLAPDVTIDQARGEVVALAARMEKANASTSAGMSAAVLPVWQSHYGIHDGLRAPLALLTGACGLMLLIVCANIANLLLTRVSARRKELGLRIALGAPRLRLVRQLVTESAVLTFAGCALGLLATVWLSGSLQWLVPSFAAPGLLRPRVSLGVLGFTVALACGVALLAGIAPALHAARESMGDALNEVSRTSTGGSKSGRLRGALVMCEVALAAVSLVGAGLFLKSFDRVRAVQPGFEAAGVAMGRVSLSAAGFDRIRASSFLTGVRERLERVPGVTDVSYSDYVPLSMGAGSWEDLDIEGYVPGASENMKLYRTAVAPGWFGLMRIGLLEGRDFGVLDDTAHAPAMIVNQEFARRFFRGESPIGRKVKGWGRWFTVVGLVRDSKVLRLSEAPTPYFYVPIAQVYRPEFPFTFLVRTSASMDEALAAIGREVRAIDPLIPVFDAMSLDDYVVAPLTQLKTAATLLGMIAGIAFLLAAVGLYGVMADSVAQRTREIGVRLAVGAQRGDVAGLILRQAAVLLAFGLVLGLAAAAALARYGASMLFGVRPVDPLVYGGVAGLMIVIALAATGIPAFRAMRVDPMIALRNE